MGAGNSTFALARFRHHPFMEKREGGGLVCLEKQLDLLALARQILEKPGRHGALSFHIALELSLHGWFWLMLSQETPSTQSPVRSSSPETEDATEWLSYVLLLQGIRWEQQYDIRKEPWWRGDLELSLKLKLNQSYIFGLCVIPDLNGFPKIAFSCRVCFFSCKGCLHILLWWSRPLTPWKWAVVYS